MLPFYLLAYLSTYLPTCQLANLPTCQFVNLSLCTLAHLAIRYCHLQLASLHTWILAYLNTRIPANLHTWKLANLHTCRLVAHTIAHKNDIATQKNVIHIRSNERVFICLMLMCWSSLLSLIAVWADTVWTRGKRNMLLTHLPLFSCCLFHQCHCYPLLGGGGCRGICSSCKWRWNITEAPLSISSHLKIRVSSSLESCTFSNRLIVSYPGKV